MKYFYILFLSSTFLFMAQTKSPRRVRIESEVEKKVEKFRKSKQKKCDDRVMFRAIEVVDSTLLIQAKIKLSHGVERPEKPEKPEVKNATDTLPVSPLFE